MSLGEYFSVRCLTPGDAVLSHISAICRKLTVFDHTAVVVLEKIMVYASFAAPVYGSTDCITAEMTPNKI
ncbi:MAG: hypothetical protein DLM72_15680 [Candidatus Nitrosopolaris wilkensis]|nr:MAG: hypothetical protein DLM72_15680 [Candidatus Nitrosopolaris wilkensis]